VSGPLQALFDGATDTDWSGPTAISTPRLFSAADRLYFVNDSKVFYYHYASGTWALDTYAPGVQFIAHTQTEKARSIYFMDGTGKACEAGDSFADDDGTAIDWSYTSSASDFGYPGRVKITRESNLTGSGSVALQVANDYGSFDTGSTVTLGTAPAVTTGWQQIDREGTLWQFKLSGSGPARVDRLINIPLVHQARRGRMIALETIGDGSVSDRNFQTLQRLVLDTGGITAGIRFAAGTATWTGASTSANVTIPHGLGRTPVYVGTTSRDTLNEYAVTAADDTNLTVVGYRTDGAVVTASAAFYWVAIG
jgi:hypothetical protein